MPSTTPHGLRYPSLSDAANGPVGIQNLALDVADDLPYTCTSATRPSHVAGRRIFETDTGQTLISSGTTWLTEGGGTRQWTHWRGTATASDNYGSGSLSTLASGTFSTPPAGAYLVTVSLTLSGSVQTSGILRLLLNGVSITGDHKADVATNAISQTWHYPYTWTGGALSYALSHQGNSGTITIWNPPSRMTLNWLGRI